MLTIIIEKPMTSRLYKYKLSCVEGHLVLQSPSHFPDSLPPPAATGHPDITDLCHTAG